MGVVVCSTHGSRRGKLVCREIREALGARTPLPARADISLGSEIGQTLTMTLCGACIVEHAIPTEPAPIADEDLARVEGLVDQLDSVCRTCFSDAERELGTRSR